MSKSETNTYKNVWAAFESTLEAANEKSFRSHVLMEVVRYSREYGKKATAKKLGIDLHHLKADIKNLYFLREDYYSLQELIGFASSLNLAMRVTFYENTDVIGGISKGSKKGKKK